jgi:hypothetical protein
MERTQVLNLMSTLKLYGMRSAYDEVMGNGIKRQHEPPRIVGDLLQSEIAEKQARSIRYQLSIAKLPLAKDIDDFESPINAMSFSSAAREQERAIWPSPSHERSSAMARAAGSSMLSIWSIGWKSRHGMANRGARQIISPGSTSSSSMNSAIYRLPRPEDSCCST